MKDWLKFILILVLILFLISYGNVKIENQKSINIFNIHIKISDSRRFNITENNLYFEVKPGKSVSGNIFLDNKGDKTKTSKIFVEGEISDWIELSEKKFKIQKNEKKNIELTIKVPENAHGDYTCKLRIESY